MKSKSECSNRQMNLLYLDYMEMKLHSCQLYSLRTFSPHHEVRVAEIEQHPRPRFDEGFQSSRSVLSSSLSPNPAHHCHEIIQYQIRR